MNTDVVLVSLLGLFGLWIVVYYLWPDFRNDSYREDIFSVRDEMFMYAAKNCVPFDHPAYTILRTRMNGLLRHGHELTLTRLLILFAVYKDLERIPNESFNEWERAVEQLPDQAQEQMRDFNKRTNIFVLQHLVFRSFFLYLVVRPLMYVIRVRDVMDKPHVTNTVERLESATLEGEESADLVTV
jgi:hypothetical protein